MLDGSPKKTSVKVPLISNKNSWEYISQELFDKCLTWPEGSLYDNHNVSLYAESLAELVRSLSYFELSTFEARDIRDFFNHYSNFLAVIENGPQKPNGFHLRNSLKPKQLFEKFGQTAGRLIEIVDDTLETIAKESTAAFQLHELEQDKTMSNSNPRAKSRIPINGEVEELLSRLDEIAIRKSNRKVRLRSHPTPGREVRDFATPAFIAERPPLNRAV